MRFFLLTQRSSAMADYVFKLPTTTTGPISPSISAYDFWQKINTALSEIWGVEMILLLIFLTLIILTAITAWKGRTKFESYQTKISLDLCNHTLFFRRTLAKLTYTSDYYRIEIAPKGLIFEKAFWLGCVKLRNCITIRNKLTGGIENITTSFYFPPWQIKGIQSMFSNNLSAFLVISNRSGKLLDIITVFNKAAEASPEGLYPTLPSLSY